MNLRIILATVIALGLMEAAAWWWMHPARSNQSGPVLSYQRGIVNENAAATNQQSTLNNPQSDISSTSPHLPSPISHLPHFTLLPELYREAAPVLRCTSGEVFHVALDHEGRTSLSAAWFEWDDTDTGSVLEAFRHPPEACMGAVGMKLVSKEKPIRYTVSVRDQESDSSSNLLLIFDHTIFREPGASANPLLPAPPVHAFRAVWVAGISDADARQGIDGLSLDNLRAIRLRAVINRLRPPHARVIQGTVRGHHSTQEAWDAFEQAVLQNLTITP